MKRRIGGQHTGLGGNAETLLDGKKTKDKKLNRLVNKIAKDCYLTFFKGTKMDQNYCDAQARDYEFRFGIEATYMYDDMKIISITEDKSLSSYATGVARGGWGSGLCATVKYYKQYTYKSKFIRFVDKWHPLLFKIK